jgi:hypothetical protein
MRRQRSELVILLMPPPPCMSESDVVIRVEGLLEVGTGFHPKLP